MAQKPKIISKDKGVMKKALVMGGGGFIGHHLVSRLKDEGYYVCAADIKAPEYENSKADLLVIGDLRKEEMVAGLMKGYDEVYQLAADMGGAGFVFTKEHDLDIMHNSAMINLHVAKRAHEVGLVFFSSSACVYPEGNQTDERTMTTREESVYPANPDSNYGWEKIFSERLYQAARANKRANTYIARFHNVYGPLGTWRGGREKSPAAICRKILEAGEHITLWGDGQQKRSFMYIDDCIDGIRTLVQSPHMADPINLGTDDMISIENLALLVMDIAGKRPNINYIPGPVGVNFRNSDNSKCFKLLQWIPKVSLITGMSKLYNWIKGQVNGSHKI